MPLAGWTATGVKWFLAASSEPQPKSRFKDVWTPGQAEYERVFHQGREAFQSGIGMHGGPHELGAFPTYSAWVDGWLHAQEAQQHGVKI